MIDSFSAANMAILNFWTDNQANLSEAQADRLSTIISTPIMPEKVSHFAEFVYANSDAFDASAKAIAADVCLFATSYSFYGLGADNRGNLIAAVLNGDEVEEAPAPLSELVIESTPE